MTGPVSGWPSPGGWPARPAATSSGIRPPPEHGSWSDFRRADGSGRRVPPGHRQIADEGQDQDEEDRAGADRTEAETAVGARLREVVAERGAQRSGEDVRDPERR